jgi:hypothetical protein
LKNEKIVFLPGFVLKMNRMLTLFFDQSFALMEFSTVCFGLCRGNGNNAKTECLSKIGISDKTAFFQELLNGNP